MSDALASLLFQSTTRSAVLDLLFVRGVTASVSELARRAGLSPRSVGNEVRHLRPTGLILVETLGGADVVRANRKHVGARHLTALLQTPTTPAVNPGDAKKVRESLAAWGAPLAGVQRVKRHSLHEALLHGLHEAQKDGTVLRVLPTVLARHVGEVDWRGLREDARRQKLKAELGLLVELTAAMTDNAELRTQSTGLQDRRRKKMRFLPEVKNRYEAELAKQRSPEVAGRWGFWMNMSEDSFRGVYEKHGA
jgi:hypothetical protein